MKNCVRQLRRGLEISQEELAVAVGVSRHTIIGLEKQGQEPSATLALKIAQYFSKDPREIFFTESVNYIQHDMT